MEKTTTGKINMNGEKVYLSKMAGNQIFIVLFLAIISTACSNRNLIYMKNLEADEKYQTQMDADRVVRIQTGDLLKISLSSLQPEMNIMFNDSNNDLDFNTSVIGNINEKGFLVDENGEISIPVVGKLKLLGMTKLEAKDLIEEGIKEYIVDPVVSVQFANFKVTVLGEVKNPNTFYVPSEDLNIFEALGLAGDMTEYGIREDVRLIREVDGVRTVVNLDLSDKYFLSSPYYKLQQNDILYVQASKFKSVKASTNERNMTFLALGVSLLVPILFSWQYIFGN
jgi:polysaccharide biosynthesis/export protein